MRQNFVAQFVQLLKCWLCNMWSGVVLQKNYAHFVNASCRYCGFQGISSICWALVLKYNGFARIQKAVIEQTISRPPNSDHDLVLGCRFGFGKCFEASSPSNCWAGHHQFCKIHFSSHVTIRSRNGSLLLHRIREDDTPKWWFFFFFWYVLS